MFEQKYDSISFGSTETLQKLNISLIANSSQGPMEVFSFHGDIIYYYKSIEKHRK